MMSMLIVLTTHLSLLAVTCYGHVGLYYPPARKYALDFLDSARTVHPCGMSSGLGSVTDLKAGSTFNVSWYLGYAHPGGFRLELLVLDSLGNINKTFSLTSPAGEFIGSNNITTTSYMVTLPMNVTSCSNCTIRLVRQALNWGPNYLFWSCADVNIVSQASVYTPSCGGHGSFNAALQTCQCDNTYSGTSCEFNDDCSTSSDCGTNGTCIQITTYSYPQKQCFCEAGWFGLHCEKKSLLTSVQFNAALYNNATLSPSSGVKLYYRVLTDTNEIEVVLQGRTTSYLGIGWKSINNVCKPFSLRYKYNAAQPEPEPEPEPTVSGASTPNVEPIPEGEAPSHGAAAEPEVTGRNDVNGMDCADIIIGAAVGQLSRIGDYYTSDRSTPRLDEFYGGTQSLTAAVGAESNDGLTTIIFRKPLQATELTDNAVTNDLMTVIWAYGQTSSADNFYSQDEIKYHSTNRGKLSINFYEQQQSSPGTGSSTVGGSWADSTGCQSSKTCRYQVTWSLDVTSDVISFSITTNQSMSAWTAIAFTKEKKMENMDVYGAFIDSNNMGVTFDGWTGKRYAKPVRDAIQNIKNASVHYNAGLLTFNFQRSRDTGDKSDWAFTDSNCYYFVFPVGGGAIINFTDLGPHAIAPIISREKICIASKSRQAAPSNLPSLASYNHVTALFAVVVAYCALVTFQCELY